MAEHTPIPALLPPAIAQQLPIATDAQGQSTVSARELHAFLGSKTKFATWIERRINEFGFIQNQDYVICLPVASADESGGNRAREVFPKFGKNPSGGRPEIDYTLSLVMAKELAMVERNQQGKAARQYFIACESRLRQLTSQPLGPVQDVLLGQSQRIADLESKLSQVLDRQQQAAHVLLALPRSSESVPTESTRTKIQRIVNAYCQTTGVSQQDTWRKVYKRLYYAYKVRIRRYKKRSDRESWLDVAERNGHLDKIYVIVSDDLTVKS